MSTPSTAFPDPDDDPNNDSAPKPPESSGRSRLDREVDEILTHTMKSNPLPPIPFKQRVAEKRSRMPHPPAASPWYEVQRILTAIPILTALACAILCVMVAGASPLLARLFAIAAVVALIYPIVLHLRGGSKPAGPQLWRGQVMDTRPPQASPLDEVKRWFRSRPPR
ncbi:MAG: hypothetical protein ACR2OE_11960 [Thermomicrobiales bacterium]